MMADEEVPNTEHISSGNVESEEKKNQENEDEDDATNSLQKNCLLEEPPLPTEDPSSSFEDTTKEDRQACEYRNHRWTLVLLALAVALLVLGIALPMTLKKASATSTADSTSNQASTSDEESDISAPPHSDINDHTAGGSVVTVSTAPPTNTPVATAPPREYILLERLESILPDYLYQRVIDDPTSHEYAAFEDLLQENDKSIATTTFQRFILTTWNVAVAGDFFVPDTPECQWEGVVCDKDSNATIAVQWNDRGLSGRLPDSILPSLTSIDLGDNQRLTGSIPEIWYTNATKLEYLYLHNNALTGTLSTQLGQWQNLRRLYLAGNRFTGSIPRELGSLNSGPVNARPLEYLSLHDNNFLGTLPNKWNLRNLFYLDLGKNQLSGSIPSDWVEGRDRMNKLRVLYLDHNRFTGKLPSRLGEIGNARLNLITISENEFTGDLPTFYNFTRKLNVLELENSGVTGMDKTTCQQSVFEKGEMIRLKADCDICLCKELCSDDLCYDGNRRLS